MCHTDDDQELWESDPVEYIRIKYGMYTPKSFHIPLKKKKKKKEQEIKKEIEIN